MKAPDNLVSVLSPDDLGAELARLRRQAGLTQAQLATEAGVSRKWLVDAEGGRISGTVARYMQVLAVLGQSFYVGEAEA